MNHSGTGRIRKVRTHYATLGVRPNATAEEIKAARGALLRRYYPEMNEGKTSKRATEIVQNVHAAYAVLRESSSRRAYDIDLQEKKKRQRIAYNAKRRVLRRAAAAAKKARARFVAAPGSVPKGGTSGTSGTSTKPATAKKAEREPEPETDSKSSSSTSAYLNYDSDSDSSNFSIDW